VCVKEGSDLKDLSRKSNECNAINLDTVLVSNEYKINKNKGDSKKDYKGEKLDSKIANISFLREL